jgi:hypothetical protein
LLAVPSQRTKADQRWSPDELAEIISDTMELAKVRAVDPDAMGAVEEEASGEAGVGLMFPTLMLPTDPEKPGWAREATVGSLEDWLDALLAREACATFEEYTLRDNLGDQFQLRGFNFSSGNDYIVARLLAAGETPTESAIRMCIFSTGNLEIELPAPADYVLLRTGWIDSVQNIELYNDASERINQGIDTSNTRPAGMLRTGTQIIGVKRLDTTLHAAGIKKIRLTGDNVLKFILAVAVLGRQQ